MMLLSSWRSPLANIKTMAPTKDVVSKAIYLVAYSLLSLGDISWLSSGENTSAGEDATDGDNLTIGNPAMSKVKPTLLAGNILSCVAATAQPVATVFWDRLPKATPGRLRRVLSKVAFHRYVTLPVQLCKKNSVFLHLPFGSSAKLALLR